MKYFAPVAFRAAGKDYPYGEQDLNRGEGDPLVATGQLVAGNVPDGGSLALPAGAIILYGTYANRPAAGPAYANRVYICTDRYLGAPAYCDATSWIPYGVGDRPITEVTASRNLTAADDGALLESSSASAVTLTLVAGLPLSFRFRVMQVGAGKVTIAATGGAAVHAQSSKFSCAAQYAVIEVLPTLTVDDYIVTGQSGT